MAIKLTGPFAPDTAVDEADMRQMKKALNRYGCYTPYKNTGITGISDGIVFSALKKFQKDHGLKATGTAKPDDETIEALNKFLDENTSGKYIWHTVGDDKVRPEHAALDGTVRDWKDTPNPETDYNCRCWAVAVEKADGLSETLISEVKDSEEKWSEVDFIKHFISGGGREVSLEKAGYLQDIISIVHANLFKSLSDQITAVAQETIDGDFEYTTSNSYTWLADVLWVFGAGTIRTSTKATVEKIGKLLTVDGTIDYEYDDVFTDPLSLRQNGKEGSSNLELTSDLRAKLTDFGGDAFPILGAWQTSISGTILFKDS